MNYKRFFITYFTIVILVSIIEGVLTHFFKDNVIEVKLSIMTQIILALGVLIGIKVYDKN